MQFSQDPETGFLAYSVSFEPESFAGPAINGDVPTMEKIDFSTPKFDIPPIELTSPYIILPPTVAPSNHPTKVVIASNYGVFYTENFNADAALIKWMSMNNGLDALDQAQISNMVVTPSGKIYMMTNGKIMYASGLGGIWETYFSNSDVVALIGNSRSVIMGLGINPLSDDMISVLGGVAWYWDYGFNFGHLGFFLGDSDAIGLVGGFDNTHGGQFTAVFTNGGWTIFTNGLSGILGSAAQSDANRFSAAGGFVGTWHINGVEHGEYPNYSCAAGTQDIAWMWCNGFFYKVTGNGSVFTPQSISPSSIQGVSFSPTGNFGMGCSGSTPYRTTDGGATWLAATGVIPIGPDVWENCRDDFRWIFGGGATIRLTMDHGASYFDKTGDLYASVPLIDITQIRFIE